MNRFDNLLDRLNFRKLAKVYLIVSAVLVIICGFVIAYSMRDKIYMALDYGKMSNSFRRQGINDNFKSQVNKLTSDSKDIINIFVLDKQDNVIFKANDALIRNNSKLTLTPYENNRRYLKDNINNEIIYRISRDEEIILNKDYIQNHKKIDMDINDEFSYERDLGNYKVYLLNYMVNKNTMTKVFVVRNVTPIPYAERLIEASGGILLIIFGVYWVGLALWVYRDANRKKANAALWGLLVLVTNLAGLIIYTIYKQNNKICHKCGYMQSKDNIFCSTCGVKINETCSKCGNIVIVEDNYCHKCGNKL